MLVSDPKGRDIKMDSFTLSFHGRLLIENAEVSLNYGQRYGLLGENGSGKVRVLHFFGVRICAGGDSSLSSSSICNSRRSCNPLPSGISRSRNTSTSTSSAARRSRRK